MLQPHVDSYYAATANESTDFAALRGEHSADVCVIGAGFTGIATALHLSERGYKVHVVEANRVGWGASGRNGGQLIAGIAAQDRLIKLMGEKAVWELRWAGHEIIKEWVSTYNIECDLKFGYIDVAIKQRHVRDLERLCRYLDDNNLAYEHRLLSQSETRELIGTDAYIGALLNMGNRHLHPLNLKYCRIIFGSQTARSCGLISLTRCSGNGSDAMMKLCRNRYRSIWSTRSTRRISPSAIRILFCSTSG